MKAIRGLLKVFTSGELIELLDKNGDGKVSWSEIKSAPVSVWFEIVMKYAPGLLILLL